MAGYPRSNPVIGLASAESELLTAQEEIFNNPPPVPPGDNEPVPQQ